MKALMPLAWIVPRPFMSNIVGDFVNDFTEKSLNGGKLSSDHPGLELILDQGRRQNLWHFRWEFGMIK